MPFKTQSSRRRGRRRLRWLVMGAFMALLAAIIFFAVGGVRGENEGEVVILTSPAERQDYLESLGWRLGKNTNGMVEEKSQAVTIPEVFDGVYASYAQMLKEGGFDLYDFKGASAQLYSYALANWPENLGGGPVTATLIVLNDQLIGGDISQDEANGFSMALVSMESMNKEPEETSEEK